MTSLRVVIADDERPAREYLKKLVSKIDEVEIVGEAENGLDAVDLIGKLSPDLALLDLQMPELSGLEVVKKISEDKMPLVAFVTAFDDYAVQAFELNAIDYLLKPVELSRLRETIARAFQRLENADWRDVERKRLEAATETIEHTSGTGFLKRIPVRMRDDIYLVPVDDIASIVADGELLYLTTADRTKYTINYRLKDLEARLDPELFVRLSRGSLANIKMVERISPVAGGTYIVHLINGQELTSSRLQSKALRAQLLRI
ncbi:MAG: response regulator transcription factor [Acidobacteria bacterium]|nr:response regulator transcription factor [Acidobacteriota bacterium]